ncbi:MAG: LCP family protein [Fimbriimonadales bacterium]|nr:LCP family protein [Fimbriimonadales bacterium]
MSRTASRQGIAPPVKRNSRLRRMFWAFFWLMFWLSGLVLGSALGYLHFASEGTVSRAVVAYIKGETKPENAFPGRKKLTILVVGADENRDNRKRVVDTMARTDTIMVAQVDFVNQRIHALSIPRDTLVRIPRHGWGKINSAHALGGPKLLVETVSTLLGNLAIDEVVMISYKAFEEAIDALGGVTIEVEKRMRYHDNWGDLHVDLQPGLQHLNGKQALGYVRFRHTDSDFHRIERQQKFMRAVKERLKDPSVWMRAPQVLAAGLRHTRTTMDFEQLLALALFARQLSDEQIRTETLPVRDGSGTSLIVQRDAATQLIRELGFWDDAYSHAP